MNLLPLQLDYLSTEPNTFRVARGLCYGICQACVSSVRNIKSKQRCQTDLVTGQI
jgi:hypothetical protein